MPGSSAPTWAGPDGFREAWDLDERLWDEMAPRPGVPHDRTARPTLDESLALRLAAMAAVRRVVEWCHRMYAERDLTVLEKRS